MIYINAPREIAACVLARSLCLRMEDWRYVSRSDCLRGLRGGTLVLFGDHNNERDRRERHEMRLIADHNKMVVLTVTDR